jgi:hypothetical protein
MNECIMFFRVIMLRETYFAVAAKVKQANPNAKFYAVALKVPWFFDRSMLSGHLTELAPSPTLLAEFKKLEDTIGKQKAWSDAKYEERFRRQILDDSKALETLKKLWLESKEQDVFIICWEKDYPCHRFILLEIANEKQREWGE